MRAIPFVTLFLVGVTASFGTAGQLPADPANNIWRSAGYLGGSDYEFAQRLGVDGQGNTYLLGRTFSRDMHASVVPVSRASGERASATFVLKIDPDGQTVYATPVGTGFGFLPIDVAVSFDGTAHVLVREGDVAHVLKLEPSAGRSEYDVIFNGLDRDGLSPKAIAVDDAGHAVIAGWSQAGIFVARLDARGSVFDIDVIPMQADARDLAVDDAGAAYVVGAIASDGLPSTPGAFQPRYNNSVCSAAFPPMSDAPARFPCLDGFIVKLTRDGRIAYATYFGGGGVDEV